MMSSLTLLSFLSFTSHGLMDLTLFDSSVEGRCLDGSSAGYYYEAPQYGDSDLWVIFLQGGGHCATKEECDSRNGTNLGGSGRWNSHVRGTGCYSTVPHENPDFYTGHHVYIPYCCGDWHSGKRTKPSNETWGYYFSGHLILSNVLDDLTNKYPLDNAKQVLIAGDSAGGIGTILNLDYMAQRINKLNAGITVKGAPIAGWFFPGNTTDQPDDPMMPPNAYPQWKQGIDGGFGHNSSVPDLWDAYLQPNCVSALGSHNSWHCFSAHNLYKYIETPIFIIENMFDSDQITYEMEMPNVRNSETREYVSYFGNNMNISIFYQLYANKIGNGMFLASCYDHVLGINLDNYESFTHINGYNSTQIVGDWFWGRDNYPNIVFDSCVGDQGLPCNPTCNDFGG